MFQPLFSVADCPMNCSMVTNKTTTTTTTTPTHELAETCHIYLEGGYVTPAHKISWAGLI